LAQKSAGGEGEEEASDEENLDDELRWEQMGGEIIRLTLQPNDYGFGLSLAGTHTHKARHFPTFPSFFLCSLEFVTCCSQILKGH